MVPPRIGNFSILFSFLSTPPPRLPTSFPAGSKALLAGSEAHSAVEGIIQAPRLNLASRMHMVFGMIYFEM